MPELLIYLLTGLFAGFIRAVITGKGKIVLPSIEVKHGHRFVNLGFLTPMLIGAACGWLAPYALGVNCVMSFLAAYSGADFIENCVERILKLPAEA